MHVVVIGNGIAGITAARHIRKRSNAQLTVISEESDYFFSRPALMYLYMGHMRHADVMPYPKNFWEKNRIDLVRGQVLSVDTEAKAVVLEDGRRLCYDNLIMATGSVSSQGQGWPGDHLSGIHSLYGLRDLAHIEEATTHATNAVVVGGGLIGVELAEMLHSRGIHVTLLVREPRWMPKLFGPKESQILEDHIRSFGIDLRTGHEMGQIHGHQGRVTAVQTTQGDRLPADFVGIAIGVRPNTELVPKGMECDRGILVDPLLATSIPNIYAIGDCAQLRQPAPGRRPIEAVWYVGLKMGACVAETICGTPTAYKPGVWFNSAKFFDLEYQVYGQASQETTPTEASLYWQHQHEPKSIRINYRKSDGALLGISLLGIRYRHELCDAWIKAGTPIESVLKNLGAANFDPEFFAEYEPAIIAAFNAQSNQPPLHLKKHRGLDAMLGVMHGVRL